MSDEWFEQLFGFRELSYADTKQKLSTDRGTLRSVVNGKRYSIGHLETPSLEELRSRGEQLTVPGGTAGRLRVSTLVGDARQLHVDRSNEAAVFQVASQFNLLEMISPNVVPEDGITRYVHDRTQGPACAVAAGAATAYRNYFAQIGRERGQTRDRQIDCLADVGDALGNEGNELWEMRNGYALCNEEGLNKIASMLQAASRERLEEIRGRLRVGVHWDVDVTAAEEPYPAVHQVFCSALPVSYTSVHAELWESFASLILEAAYEATLWAGVLSMRRGRSAGTVFLTQLGGGAFGNRAEWILRSMRRSLQRFRNHRLEVRLVSFGRPDADLERIADEFD